MRRTVIYSYIFITGVILSLLPAPVVMADSYPYATKPCIHAPYARTGTKPNWCPDYDWGDRRNDERASNVISPYGYYYRNCTDYVAWRLHLLGVPPARYKGLGNAHKWATPAAHKHLRVDGTPAQWAVAVRTTGTYGHVAIVEAVHPSGIIEVAQYNKRGDGNFSTARGTPQALGFTRFVHFEDTMPLPPPSPVVVVPSITLPPVTPVPTPPAPEIILPILPDKQAGDPLVPVAETVVTPTIPALSGNSAVTFLTAPQPQIADTSTDITHDKKGESMNPNQQQNPSTPAQPYYPPAPPPTSVPAGSPAIAQPAPAYYPPTNIQQARDQVAPLPPPQPLTPQETQEKLANVVNNSQEVLAEASTVFPFVLFPDTLSIDREKITLTRREFFRMAEVVSIHIRDILSVVAHVGPFFGSLKVSNRFFDHAPALEIKYLSRHDALKIKNILQGYIIATQQRIDCAALPKARLAGMLEELGSGESAAAPPV